MRILVTGSSGHLGEAIMRVLRRDGTPVGDELVAARDALGTVEAIGVDITPGPFTTHTVSITDREALRTVVAQKGGIDAIIHTATLHKPHVASHSEQQFVDVNVSGTLALLELASEAGVRAFILTSTTSVYSKAIARSVSESGTAAWVSAATIPAPKNIYGITKIAAESLCGLHMNLRQTNTVVLRTSRFFHEPDDDKGARDAFSDANAKVNEFLYRRVDVEDIVLAHLLAVSKAPTLVQAHRATPAGAVAAPTFIVSAPSPLHEGDTASQDSLWQVVRRRVADDDAVEALYRERGWRLPDALDRVYDSSATAAALGWQPRYTFDHICLAAARGELPTPRSGGDAVVGSALAAAVGRKGYHGHGDFTGKMDAVGQPFDVHAGDKTSHLPSKSS